MSAIINIHVTNAIGNGSCSKHLGHALASPFFKEPRHIRYIRGKSKNQKIWPEMRSGFHLVFNLNLPLLLLGSFHSKFIHWKPLVLPLNLLLHMSDRPTIQHRANFQGVSLILLQALKY